MIYELVMNVILIALSVFLFFRVHGVLGRVCLVVGMVLLIGIANILLSKLTVRKDTNGNPLHTYFVSFRDPKNYAKAETFLKRYGTVARKTSTYLSLTTSMKANQARNAIRSDMKLQDGDFNLVRDSFLSK